MSLAELAAADIRLRPAEAVAIVSAICRQHLAGTLRGIPSPGVIRLTRDGDVVAKGPITTNQDEVTAAALLLTDLLSGFDALPEYRASGALRLAIARALGTMDLPPYQSLDEFCTALARFTTEDVRDVAQGLFSAWERARASRAFKAASRADLTISDVRRARRATGLSLSHVAAVAEVPPTRLRDLEWGYMRDWPPTPEGRAQVIRYARAAGLDEAIVLSIAWPMILEGAVASGGERDTGVALVPTGPQTLIAARPVVTVAARPVRQLRRVLVAAAGIVALLGAFAMGWRSTQPEPPRQDAGQRAELPVRPDEAPAALPQEPAETPDVTHAALVQTGAARSTVKSPVAAPRRESARAPARRESPRPAVTPPPKPRPPAATARRNEPRKPFLERELFRIVIR